MASPSLLLPSVPSNFRFSTLWHRLSSWMHMERMPLSVSAAPAWTLASVMVLPRLSKPSWSSTARAACTRLLSVVVHKVFSSTTKLSSLNSRCVVLPLQRVTFWLCAFVSLAVCTLLHHISHQCCRCRSRFRAPHWSLRDARGCGSQLLARQT